LRETEEQCRLLVESANEGILMFQEGMLKFVNPKFQEMMGFTKEELMSKPFAEFMHPDDRAMAMERHLKMLKGELDPALLYQFRLIDKSGNVKRMEIKCAINTWQGKPATINFLSDVTERKKSEEELQVAKEQLQALYDASPDMIFIHNTDGRILSVNDSMLRQYGYDSVDQLQDLLPSELSGEGCTAEMAMENIRLALEGRAQDFEWTARRRNGETFPVEVRLRKLDLLTPVGNRQPGILAVVRDMTERSKATANLVHHTRSLQKLLDVSRAITVTTDRDKLFRTIIATAQELLSLDYSTLMVLSHDKKQLIIKDTIGFSEDMIDTFSLVEGQGLSTYVVQDAVPCSVFDFRTETRFEVPPIVREKGITSAVSVPMMFEGAVLGVLIGHTITQRTFTAEEISLYQNIANLAAVAIQNSLQLKALQESEQKYRMLVESANDAIFMADAETGIIIDANKRAGDLLGIPPAELIGMHQSQLHPPDEMKRYQTLFQEHVDVKQTHIIDAFVCARNGDLIPVEISASTIEVGGRKIKQGLFRDIRERRQAEKEQQKLTSIIENTSDFIGMATMDGSISYINPAGRSLVGLGSLEDAREKNMFAFVVDEDLQKLQEIITLILHERGWKGELRFRHFFTSQPIPVEINIMLILDPDTGQPVGVAAIASDLSERKWMEAELIKSQKLESLGVLAGGIAHDFNNILTAIMGNLALAQMRLGSEGKVVELLMEAELATGRAKDLTQQLLTFSRGGEPVKAVVSMGPLIKEAARFALSGAQSRCEFSFPDDLWTVEADPGQIGQVFSNLLINANQAMPEGGTISIIGKNMTLNEQAGLPLPPGPYVSLAVKDTGVGIEEGYLLKIFDPYFTTKQSGSGLGLASAYSIVKKHDGFIAVESRPGAGSTFTIYLPAVTGVREQGQVGEVPNAVGKASILIMDDEDAIRHVLTEMLQFMGYTATAVKNGEEALEAYQKALASGVPYDVVITDLTVPGGKGGRELMKDLRTLDPQVRAIVSSGYSNDPIMANFRDYGFSGVIVKPFRNMDLATVVSSVLREVRPVQ